MTNQSATGGLTAQEKRKAAKAILLRDVAEARQTNHRANSKGISHALFVHLTAYAGHEVTLGEITPRFCSRFARYLQRSVELSSARTYLEKFSAILATCLRKRYLLHNPMPPVAELLPKAVWHERPYLTADEIQRMTNAECPSLLTKQAFLFSCYTGLRLSDIETLTWDQIHRHDSGFTIVKRQAKTGREVRIPLVQQACLILMQVERGRGRAVFNMRSRSSIGNDMREWVKNAGIEKHVTYHTSRHSFATMLVSGDVDIYTISKLCGHANVSTTERYAHITEKRLQEGVATIENLMLSTDVSKKISLPRCRTRNERNQLRI